MPKTSNGCWLTPHNGTGHRYKRPVPKDAQEAFGKWFKVVYFNAEVSRAEAERQARVLAAQDDQRLAWFRSLSDTERGDVPRWLASQAMLPLLSVPVPFNPRRQAAAVAALDGVGNVRAATWEGVSLATPAGQSLMEADFQAFVAERRADAARVLKVEPASEFSWDGLLDVLKRKQPPKDIASYERSLKLLRDALPELADYRKVEPPHIERFLRYMVELNVSVPMQYHHRSNVSAMFRRVVPLIMHRNPCNGAAIDAEYVEEPRHPYTGKEVRSILETAKRLKVGKSYKGGDASRECLWLLRLEAFHGCRAQEPSQLQRGDLQLIDVRDVDLRDIGLKPDDVCTLNGFIPTLWFRKECAATGKPHDEKSIKTGEDRHVALHPVKRPAILTPRIASPDDVTLAGQIRRRLIACLSQLSRLA